MKKIYLLLFLCNSFFSVHAQNKKVLNTSILRLQSDSAAMSNTLEEKERIILKNTNKIEELHSLTKSNISEIEHLKKIITENEKLISHKNIILDSLVMDLTATNDSLASIMEANSIASESNWIITNLMGSLQGRWVDDCEYIGPETYKITIDKN